jgi:hypothetical protein
MSNARLVSLTAGVVRFRWKDYADRGRTKVMALDATEFLRRFLLHVLPRGFVRIRHFGLLANRQRCGAIACARQLLPGPPRPTAADHHTAVPDIDPTRCPVCHQGRWRVTLVSPVVPRRMPVAADTS